ncbi:MAG: hypothetical protein HY335_06650 [Deinococcus sp.]|nr:hypothetical protein [Deinococcus sp.]
MLKRNCVHFHEMERQLTPGAILGRERASRSRDLLPRCALNKLRRNDCPARCDGFQPRLEPAK